MTFGNRVRRPVLAGAVVVVSLVVAACGQSDGPRAVVPNQVEPRLDAEALLELAGTTSINGVETPDGGFVVFAMADEAGRIERSGAVFNSDGEVTGGFELDVPVALASAVVADDVLYLVGTHCDDAPRYDDQVDTMECSPRTPVARTVHLTTGAVDELPPPPMAEGQHLEGFTLFRLDDTVVAVSSQPNAWVLDDTSWTPVDAPTGLACQSAGTLIDHVTEELPPPPSDEFVTSRSEVTPELRVLDPRTRTWGPVRSGPVVNVPTALGLSLSCSDGYATFEALSTETGGSSLDHTFVSYSLDEQTWTDARSVGTDTWVTPVHNGPGLVLQAQSSSTWSWFDPATGVTTPFDRSAVSAHSIPVSASDQRILVFDEAARQFTVLSAPDT